VFERFTERARKVLGLAYEEADRLRHDYVGPEHVLAGLSRQEDSRAAAILRGAGLGPGVLRAALDDMVAHGHLPGPRSKADLLRSLGIDLAAVQQAAGEAFGMDALQMACRHARSRSWIREDWIMCTTPASPLSGKAMLVKRAFELAGREADELAQPEVLPEHVLLGVLRDAQDLAGTGLSRRAKRARAYLGLPQAGASPVRLVLEASGTSLAAVRAHVLASLHATT
jgi:ATP-dependent Clp protease ATP-binding subunit ClpA